MSDKSKWAVAGVGTAVGVMTVAVLGVLCVGGLVLGGVVPVPASTRSRLGCGAGTPTLTLHGNGAATGRPDMLTMTLDVHEIGSSAQQAMTTDDTRVAAVDAILGRRGVPNSNIQTADVTLTPQYHYPSGGPPELVGYGVNQTLTVQIHSLATAGAVVDAAVAAGGSATSIGAVTFSDQDPTILQDRARSAAVADAVSHARAMAKAAGDRLARLCSITDDSASSSVAPNAAFGAVAENPTQTAPSVPLSAGTLTADAQVTLVYALAPGR